MGATPVAVFTPDPAAPTGTPLVYTMHTDHLNTPRVVLDKNNAIRWRWLAEPFGTTAPETNPSNLGAFAFNLRFPGQYADHESGLHYNYHRDYDPTVGRYTTSDPIGLEGGSYSTYVYVDGQPVAYVDSDGLRNVRPAQPGGSSYNRRQWRRHGPGKFDRPQGETAESAWQSTAAMSTPDPEGGDYRFRCLRWECSSNSCTRGRAPTDFLPAAYYSDDAPESCTCMQTTLGPVFHPPEADRNDAADIAGKYRRSDGQLGRMWRSIFK